jgi:hypothetical protein
MTKTQPYDDSSQASSELVKGRYARLSSLADGRIDSFFGDGDEEALNHFHARGVLQTVIPLATPTPK